MFRTKDKIGLDIGSYSIKVVQLDGTGRGYHLMKAGYKEFQQPLSITDDKVKGSLIISALDQLWKDLKIKNKKVSLCVSDPSIYSRHITVPRVAENDLVEAVKWQAEKYAPFSMENAVVDFQVLESSSKKGQDQMEIVIVAARGETIQRYLSILEAVRLVPSVLGVAPFVIIKSYLHSCPVDEKEIVAIIDIGGLTTSVTIMKGKHLQFVRYIDLGGSDLTRAVMEHKKIDEFEAEKIKKGGTLINPVDQGKEPSDYILPMIEPMLIELVAQINRSFAYCEGEFLIEKIHRVLLCGGGARLQGVDRYLKKHLGVPAATVGPFKNINVTAPARHADVLTARAPEMMAALGAALD